MTNTTSELNVLICTANLGNSKPTPSAIAAWIPENGDIKSIALNTEYPLKNAVVKDGKFDIIVIGMQEATFDIDENDNIDEEPVEDEPMNDDLLDDEFDIDRPSVEPDDFDSMMDYMGWTMGQTQEPRRLKTRHFVKRGLNTEDSKTSILTPVEKKPVKTARTKFTRKVTKMVCRTFRKIGAAIRSVTASEDYMRKPKTRVSVIKTDSVHTDINIEKFRNDTRILYDLITSRCKSYKFAVNSLRGQMRLMVLVKDDLYHELSEVEFKAVNTGIGSVLANKGGIVAFLTIRETRLSFVSAHLEAHEGKNHYENRCADLAAIFGGARPTGTRYDATISSHHCFVLGDLNFRLDLQNDNHEENHNTVCELAENRQWKQLARYDELHSALKNSDCLAGFRTMLCRFPPTFKVTKGDKDFAYNPKRIPSYTDRILWKSGPGLREYVQPFLHEPCPDYDTSDHKPIRGAFAITTNSLNSKSQSFRSRLHFGTQALFRHPRLTRGLSVKEVKPNIHVYISGLSCTDLRLTGKLGSDSCMNPYVIFVTKPGRFLECDPCTNRNKPPAGFDINDKWRSTKVMKNNKNPDWSKENFQLAIEGSFEEMISTGAMLYITAINSGFKCGTFGEAHIGTVRVNLKDLYPIDPNDTTWAAEGNREALRNSTKQKRLDMPLTKYGQINGRLQCIIQIVCFGNLPSPLEKKSNSRQELRRNSYPWLTRTTSVHRGFQT